MSATNGLYRLISDKYMYMYDNQLIKNNSWDVVSIQIYFLLVRRQFICTFNHRCYEVYVVSFFCQVL